MSSSSTSANTPKVFSPSASANTSNVVSPATSTSSMADTLIAALEVDITKKDPESAKRRIEAILHAQEQERLESVVAKPHPGVHAKWLGPDSHSISDSVKDFPNSTIAFAFDIDGVLVRSKTPLPGAAETLVMLQRRNIPFIFLTNGGGSTEKDHVAILGRRLGLTNLHEKQFVQSHTPYHSLVPQLADKNILVLGGIGSKIRDVAHAYGFKNVVIPSDIVKMNQHVYPFLEYTQDHHTEHGKDEVPLMKDGRLQIHAILVWSSPRDQGLDLQLITDLLLSEKGILGTHSPHNGNASLPNNGYLQDEQPHIYFCNPDITWATAYPLPRAAQGTFKASLQGVWAALTNNSSLSSHLTTFGKPTEATYIFGETTLQEWNKIVNGGDTGPIRTVYMIGDNPDSDIQGSRNYKSRHGSEWKSVLVETGVFEKGTVPAHAPTHFAAGVKEAVELALMEEGYGICAPEWGDENEELVFPDNSEDFGQG